MAAPDPTTPSGCAHIKNGCGYHTLDVSVRCDAYMEDFMRHLLPVVRPSWKGVELDSKVFDSGITNFLVAIFEKGRGLKESQEDVILVRVNGSGSERVINRTDEIACLDYLNKEGLCPPIYAKFSNGLCYGFLPGRQLRVEEVRDEEISGKIAHLLARLHTVKIPQHFTGREPPQQLWMKISSWMKELPAKFEDPIKQKSFEDHFVSMEALKQEVAWLQELTSSTHSPLVFCHNDTLIANFIFNDVTGTVRLVDFEYGGPNFLAFDIANHFTEFAGVEEVNFDLYPDEAFQKKWLKTYLLERAKLTGQEADSVCEEDVDTLYKDVEVFAMAAHMHWAIWSLLQSMYSIIDFNYLQYGILRYEEYLRMKNSYLQDH